MDWPYSGEWWGKNGCTGEFAAANQLCALLQNLPLALNITAQRLALRHQMYLRDMVARLRQEKSRLAALDEQDQEIQPRFWLVGVPWMTSRNVLSPSWASSPGVPSP